MTSVPSTQPSSALGFNRSVVVDENKDKEKEFHNAKIALADEMKRLYPNGVMEIDNNRFVKFTKSTLEQIVQDGTLNDANGNLQTLSPEARKAAQTILDNGGPASINPKGDPWFAEPDLRRSIEENQPKMNPVQEFDEFLSRIRHGDEV